jgi:hypothetical protein
MTALPVTFSRRMDEPFEHSLEALQRWWPRDRRAIDVGCAFIDAPDGGPDRYRVTLRFRRRPCALPMELRVTPWSEAAGTHVELLPLRAVRPSRRYFRRSRAVLNDVVVTIVAGPGHAARQYPDPSSSRLPESA